MSLNPEVERSFPKPPQDVKEIPTDMELAEKLQQAVQAQTTQTDFTAQVTDDSGQPIIQPTQTSTVTVKVPATFAQLTQWAKGSPVNALTWFAWFWLRVVKKGLRFGWKLVQGKVGSGEES